MILLKAEMYCSWIVAFSLKYLAGWVVKGFCQLAGWNNGQITAKPTYTPRDPEAAAAGEPLSRADLSRQRAFRG